MLYMFVRDANYQYGFKMSNLIKITSVGPLVNLRVYIIRPSTPMHPKLIEDFNLHRKQFIVKVYTLYIQFATPPTCHFYVYL